MIGSAYNLAIEQRLVTKNPTQGCALPKVEHKEMKTLTADQLSAFFQEARDSGVYELYYLDLATGLRRGELLGLKWADVDLDRGVLKIQRAISRQNGKVVEAPLKTKNAYRTLPLSADAIDVLMQQKKKNGQQRVGIPIAKRRPYVTGQRAAHAAKSAETGGTAPHPIPRSPPYLRDDGPAKRRGCKNGVLHAGPLLGGLHAGHLRPRDH